MNGIVSVVITSAISIAALIVSVFSFRISREANLRSRIHQHKTRECYSVEDALFNSTPDHVVELSTNSYHSTLTFSDFKTDPTAPLPSTARLVKITNWGAYPITNLDADVRIRYDPMAVDFPMDTPNECPAYVPCGHLAANGGSRIIALVNLTESEATVIFLASGTQYDIPRQYEGVQGVSLYSVTLPANNATRLHPR